jgi:hypothetical protein
MRLLALLAAAAVGAITHTLPAQAVSAQLHGHYVPNRYAGHPYWQGTPTDRLPIWRHGYYQGNDPDNFIRLQLMRDQPN